MIRVTVGNDIMRMIVMVDEETTLRDCLENNDIDCSYGVTYLNGSSLSPNELNNTFKKLGIKHVCHLVNTSK